MSGPVVNDWVDPSQVTGAPLPVTGGGASGGMPSAGPSPAASSAPAPLTISGGAPPAALQATDWVDPEQVTPAPVSTTSDVAKAGASGLAVGTAAAAGTPGDLLDLIGNASEYGLEKLAHWTGIAPSTAPDQSWSDVAASNRALTRGTNILPRTGDILQAAHDDAGFTPYQPKTLAGQLVGKSAEFAPSIFVGPGGLAEKALATAGSAVGDLGAGAVFDGTPYETAAHVAGSLLGGTAGALTIHGYQQLAPAWSDAAAKANAAGLIVDGAADPAALRTWAASDTGSGEIVPGSKPTSFQASGDLGLGDIERAVQTRDPQKFVSNPYGTGTQDQNAAQVAAMQGVQTGGDAMSVPSLFLAQKQRLEDAHDAMSAIATADAQGLYDRLGGTGTPAQAGQAIKDAVDPQVAAARQDIADKTAAIGGQGTAADYGAQIKGDLDPMYRASQADAAGRAAALGGADRLDVYGAGLRAQAADAMGQASDKLGDLWDALPKDSPMTLKPVQDFSARLYGGLGPAAQKTVTPAERSIADALTEYGPTVPFSEARQVDSLITASMRQELKTNGRSAAYARMTQLKGAYEDALHASLADHAADDADAVAAGTMDPSQTIGAKIQAASGNGGAPGAPSAAFTPAGTQIGTDYGVVDLSDLTASHRPDGTPNPAFPPALQPRDRSSAASQAQVAEMASNLQPERLGHSTSTTDGAPIIGPDGIVESGNGRVLALGRAYDQGGRQAAAYRAFLEGHGYDLTGMDRPVLVRQRTTPLTQEQREAFARESNINPVLSSSAPERAAADAGAISDGLLSSYHGGDVGSAANRPFVRGFLNDATTPGERGSLVAGDGSLSREGAARVNNALLHAGYGDTRLVSSLAETGDPDIAAFGRSLADNAGRMAQLRRGIAAGEIHPGADLSGPAVEAARVVQRARSSGQPLASIVDQADAFSPISREAQGLLRAGYGEDLSGRFSRARMNGVLADAIGEARQQGNGGRLFGEPLSAREIIDGARARGLARDAGSEALPNAPAGPALGRADPLTDGIRARTTDAEATLKQVFGEERGGKLAANPLQAIRWLSEPEAVGNYFTLPRQREAIRAYGEAARQAREAYFAERQEVMRQRFEENDRNPSPLDRRLAPGEGDDLRTGANDGDIREGPDGQHYLLTHVENNPFTGTQTTRWAPLGEHASLHDLVATHTAIAGARETTPLGASARALNEIFDRAGVGDVPTYTMPEDAFLKATGGRDAGGFFFPEQNRILIKEGGSPQRMLHVAVHEGLHAAFYHALNKDPEVAAGVDAMLAHAKAWRRQVPEEPGEFSNTYGLTNRDEYVSEAFSNPQFQKFLSQVPVTSDLLKRLNLGGPAGAMRSLWDAFLGSIHRAFGIGFDPKSMSLLEATVRYGDRISSAAERTPRTMDGLLGGEGASAVPMHGNIGSRQSGNVLPDVAPSGPPLSQETMDALAEARQATKDFHGTFRKGVGGDILRSDGTSGSYRLPDAGVGAKVFPKGTAGFQAVRAYERMVGDSADAAGLLHNYAAATLRKDALRPDGTLDPAGYQRWRNGYGEAFRALPPSVQASFDTAGHAAEALDRFGRFTPETAAALVPDQFFRPGVAGADGVEHLRSLIGAERADPVLGDYAASSLRRAAARPDGTIDPGRYATWRRNHGEALGALGDEVQSRFDTAASAGDALKRFGRYSPDLDPASVPELFFAPGKAGRDGVEHFRNLVGDEAANTILSDHIAERLKAKATTADGTLDPVGLKRFMAAHEPAMSAFPELAGRFGDAAKATQTIADVAAGRAAALKNLQTSAAGKFMGLSDPSEVRDAVGRMIEANNVTGLRGLMRQASADPAATEGVKRAALDHVLRRGISDGIEAGTSGVNQVNRGTFQTIVGKNRAALGEVFDPEQMKALDALSADMTRQKRTENALKVKGSPNSAADYIRAMKFEPKGHGNLLREVAEGAIGGEELAGEKGALTGAALAVGNRIRSGVRDAALRNTYDHIERAVLDPDYLKTLLMNAPIRPGEGSHRTLATKLARYSMFNAAQADAASQGDGRSSR